MTGEEKTVTLYDLRYLKIIFPFQYAKTMYMIGRKNNNVRIQFRGPIRITMSRVKFRGPTRITMSKLSLMDP